MKASEHRVVYSFKHSDAEVDLSIIQVFTLMHRIFKAMVTAFSLPFGDNVERFGQSLLAFLPDNNF